MFIGVGDEYLKSITPTSLLSEGLYKIRLSETNSKIKVTLTNLIVERSETAEKKVTRIFFNEQDAVQNKF